MYKNMRIRNLRSCVLQTLEHSLWVNLHLSFTINEWENSRIRRSAPHFLLFSAGGVM